MSTLVGLLLCKEEVVVGGIDSLGKISEVGGDCRVVTVERGISLKGFL